MPEREDETAAALAEVGERPEQSIGVAELDAVQLEAHPAIDAAERAQGGQDAKADLRLGELPPHVPPPGGDARARRPPNSCCPCLDCSSMNATAILRITT